MKQPDTGYTEHHHARIDAFYSQVHPALANMVANQ